MTRSRPRQPRRSSSPSPDGELRERVKELNCLYGIARIAHESGGSIEDMARAVTALIPGAWRYPEVARARIVLDDARFETAGFRETPWMQASEIVVSGTVRGRVDVTYLEERSPAGQAPFLPEEEALLRAVARHIALIVERREAAEAREKLEAQLRHADRLATIGQLAAGVAHELNEPIGNILGYAGLARRCPGVPPAARSDIEKIEAACLHARAIIRNLLLFARQVPPVRTAVSLNRVVEEGIGLIRDRCESGGVTVVLDLDPALPEISSDHSQLLQVLVNLAVNAIQAMPGGGRLTLGTRGTRDRVFLSVGDTGGGMTKEVAEKVYIPFFTTKCVGEGTGLGLPVVHGIVTSLGGTIELESEPGRGTRFEIGLPLMEAKGAGGIR